MTEPTFAEEARALIDAHVEAVDRALVGRIQATSDRAQIVDNVRAQIWDILRASGQDLIDAALVHDVLRRMDPPGMYGTLGGNARRTDRRHGGLKAIALFIWSVTLSSLLTATCFDMGMVAGLAAIMFQLALGYLMYRAAPGWNTRATWIAVSLLIIGLACTEAGARNVATALNCGGVDPIQIALYIWDCEQHAILIGALCLLGGVIAALVAVFTRRSPTTTA